MFPARTILHPTDFSACSLYAFRLAVSMAREQQARLVVLHVEPAESPTDAHRSAAGSGESHDKLWEALSWVQVPGREVIVDHRLTQGDPVREILRAAEETDCDLIVLGTHGRTGLERLVLGSVTEELLLRARCPVVSVRTPHLLRTALSRPPAAGPLRSDTADVHAPV